MKSSPIYNIINNPGRKSDCSFGASGRFSQEIRVGTSRTNSHVLANISVERHVQENGKIVFFMWLDGELIKSGILDGKEFEITKP